MKRGRFKVTRDVLMNPFDYQMLFKDVIVLHVDQEVELGYIFFYGASECFADIKDGEVTPEYIAIFHSGETRPEWRLV